MPRKQKRAAQMTDKELVRKMFPKPLRKALRQALLELNQGKPKRKKR